MSRTLHPSPDEVQGPQATQLQERVSPPRPSEAREAGWHEGERAAQQRAGVAARMQDVGKRALRSFMPEQHRAFFAQLPFLVVGSVDGRGQPWASVLFNRPGFATSPDPMTLNVAALPQAGDPLAK